MTGERLVGEPARAGRPGPPARALEVAEILGMCDRIVGEPGRRQHSFGWLKAPDAGVEQWLVVDSYYPAGRPVVVCRADPAGPDDHVYGELVPRHGLRLLHFAPTELGDDRPQAEARLRELIVFVEVYALVVRSGLDQNRLLLAFGVALDAGARSLGTVAAARAGRPPWAWGCAIGGSPVGVAFALFQPAGPVATEPAPLAGLIALLATFLVALALIGAAVGI